MHFFVKIYSILSNRIFIKSRGFYFPFSGVEFFSTGVQTNASCAQKKVYIPLADLLNLELDSSRHNLDDWQKILNEITYLSETGVRKVPSALTVENIEELFRLETYSQRFKYLNFLFKKEKKRLSDAEKKLKRRENAAANHSANLKNYSHVHYGPSKNTLMMIIRKQVIHQFYNKRLANAALFGQKIVFDLGYDEYMRTKEKRDCAAQLRLAHSKNRKHIWPFDLFFCNASYESTCFQFLQDEMPNISASMISITDKSYLDLFPKKKLVYLSPHAAQPLEVFDHNAVYIIGAFVDMVKREAVSIHKAEREGIQSLCLPLDSHILWGSGSKSLSIDQVFSILMTFRDTGDWREAFKHIPTRKIRRIEPDSDVCEVAADKMFLYKAST